MASIGLKRFRYALLNEDGATYGPIKTMAGAISSNFTPNNAEATLRADDTVKEYVTGFQNASVTLGIDHDDDTIFAEILGKTIDEETGIVASSIDDVPPYLGFGQIVTMLVKNKTIWRVEWFPKVKFKPFIPEVKTKGESIEFTTPTVEGIIIANEAGFWEYHQALESESEAIIALDAFFIQQTP